MQEKTIQELIDSITEMVMEEMQGMIHPGLNRGAPAINPEDELPDDWITLRDLRGGG